MIIDVSSKDNQIIKLARSLGQRKHREARAMFVIEGKIMVEEAFKYAQKPLYLLIIDELAETKEGKNLIAKALKKGVKVYKTPRNLFLTLCKTEEPQGVLLILKKQDVTWQDLEVANNPLLIVIDRIQDPGNLGTIIRTATSVAAEAVILSKGTVDLYNDKSLRATMGAIFKIKLFQNVGYSEIIKNCKLFDIPIVATDVKAQQSYFSWNFSQSMALVIGNEAQGVSPKLKKAATVELSIPMLGETESLNAGVASGILMYERVRQKFLENNQLKP